MKKPSGRKFTIVMLVILIFTALSLLIIIPCIVEWDWRPAKALCVPLIAGILAAGGWYFTVQVVQEHNISKNYVSELSEKTEPPEKTA